MLRVLTLATLFPDATRPNFGVFVERQTRGLAAEPDTQVTVVAPVGLPPWPLRLADHRKLAALPRREQWRGLTVHRPRFLSVPATDGRFAPDALARAVRPVLDLLAGQFDVIDASFFFPDGPAAVMLGKRYGVPVSIKARGADIHHWGKVRHAAVVAAGRGAEGLLAVSGALRTDMLALGLPAEKIRVHHTGIDRDRFRPGDRAVARHEWGVTGPTVLSLGALIPRKGHDVVLEAVARLPGVELLIAGEGPERDALAARAARLGIGRLLGAVPHGELPTLFAAVDLLALASASEGLANVWVEALACGKPIVITDAGGAREVVTCRAAGRIVARTPEAFAAGIADLLANPPAAADVVAAAAPFSWARNARELRAHLAGMV